MGQAALKKLAAPISLGIQYQLSGDRKHAEAAMPVIEQIIARGHLSDQYGNNLGDRLEKTALTYDLCYDAWPADFKRRVERHLQWGADCVLHGRRDMGRGINWNIVSNWSAPLYAGAGFAGLALWGEKGPAPTAASPCAAGEPRDQRACLRHAELHQDRARWLRRGEHRLQRRLRNQEHRRRRAEAAALRAVRQRAEGIFVSRLRDSRHAFDRR